MPTKPSDPQLEEPALFDLPLHEAAPPEARRTPAPPRRTPPTPSPEAMSLFPETADSGPGPEVAIPAARVHEPIRPEPLRDGPRRVPVASPAPARVGLLARVPAGLADLAVHCAVAIILVVGSRLLGVERTLPWAPFALCLGLFSFLYFVVPLAFWGHTPGMAWRGLQARSRSGEPLSFGQATRRWLGAVVTVALAGLPALGALRGRTLADFLSGSFVRRGP
jgi:uncharacterized RDD family membrane protein YckC